MDRTALDVQRSSQDAMNIGCIRSCIERVRDGKLATGLLRTLVVILGLWLVAMTGAHSQEPPQQGPYRPSVSAAPSTDSLGWHHFGWGARTTVDRPVSGDATLLAASVDVRSPIGDDLRMAGGQIALGSPVGGDVKALAGVFTLEAAGHVRGGLWVTAGEVTILGRVVGPMRLRAQRVVINGTVEGDSTVTAQVIEIGPLARLTGGLRHRSDSYTQDPGAVMGAEGEPGRQSPPSDRWRGMHAHSGDMGLIMGRDGHWWWMLLPIGLVLLAFAGVLAYAFSSHAERAARHIALKPWQSLGFGAALMLALPGLVMVLFISLLGIPMGVMLLAVYPALMVLGWLISALQLGRWMGDRWAKQPATGGSARFGWVLIATVVLLLLAAVPLFGPALALAAMAMGLGGMVLSWRSPPVGVSGEKA